MARIQRWYHHSNSFAAGLLSEAAIDAVDSELAQMGLGVARNVVILRDGGLKTRPPFQLRSEDPAVPVPTHHAIGDRPLESDVAAQTRFVLVGDDPPWPGEPRFDGFLEFRRHLILRASSPTAGFFRVKFRPGTRPRALTLYGCRMLAESWKTTVNGAELLTFEVWRKPRGAAAVKNHGTEHDPFEPGTFAPGVVRRDIVIPLDHTVAGPQDLEWVELRVPHSETALGLRLAVEGISAYVSDVGTAPEEPAEGEFIPGRGQGVATYSLRALDAPSLVRILPWQIRTTRLAFVLAPDHAAYYFVPDEGPAVQRGASPNAWHFTERQLREMTYTGYQTGLLLCHRDFPHPLVCSLPRPGDETIRIEPLALMNVPDLSPELVEDAGIEIDETGSVVITTPAGVAGAVTGLTVTNEDLGLLARWPSTGADAYDVMWDLASAYDADPPAWRQARGRNVASDLLPGTKTTGLPSTQYEIEGLIGDEHYVVAVRSIAAGGFSEIVEVQRGQPFRGPPTAIRNLMATPSATVGGQIDLSWSAEPLAVSYQVEWRDEDLTTSLESREAGWTRESVPQPSASSLTYGFAGQVDRRYGFRVRMEDRGGRTLDTWAEAEATAPLIFLPQVTGLTASIMPNMDGSQNAGEVVLAWNPIPNPASDQTYEVRTRPLASTDDDDWVHTDARLLTTVSVVLTEGTEYAFQARAKGEPGRSENGDWSTQVTETAPAGTGPTPDAPDRAPLIYVFHRPGIYRQVTVGWSWVPPEGHRATGYDVWYRRKQDDPQEEWRKGTAPGDEPAFTIANAGDGVTWEFRVRGTNAGGVGPWSAIVEGTTIPQPLFAPSFVITFSPLVRGTQIGSILVSWGIPRGVSPIPTAELIVNGDMKNLRGRHYWGTFVRPDSRYTVSVRLTSGNRVSPWATRTVSISQFIGSLVLARFRGRISDESINQLTRSQVYAALQDVISNFAADLAAGRATPSSGRRSGSVTISVADIGQQALAAGISIREVNTMILGLLPTYGLRPGPSSRGGDETFTGPTGGDTGFGGFDTISDDPTGPR